MWRKAGHGWRQLFQDDKYWPGVEFCLCPESFSVLFYHLTLVGREFKGLHQKSAFPCPWTTYSPCKIDCFIALLGPDLFTHLWFKLVVPLAVLACIDAKDTGEMKGAGRNSHGFVTEMSPPWDGLGQVCPPVWDGTRSSSRQQRSLACAGVQVKHRVFTSHRNSAFSKVVMESRSV